MPGKLTPSRRIDAPAALSGGETIDADAIDFAPPAGRTIGGPENLALATALVRSAITAEASISATWEVIAGIVVDQFIVQISTDSAFPDDNTRTLFTPGDQDSIAIAALKTGTTYYVRVALLMQAAQSAWSDTAARATANDTTPPGPVTGAAYDFSGRDCVLIWTNPTSDNFRHVRVDIYASNGGTHLRTAYTAAPHYTYTGDQNLVDTSGVGDPTLYVVLTPVSWFGVDSAAPVNLSPTNAAPAAPTVSATAALGQAQATVTSSPPLDLDVYEFVWKDSGGGTVRTAYSQSATDIYQAALVDTYSVVVRVRDIFGQYSSATTVGSLAITLTLLSLREDSAYSDSIGTDFSSAPNKTVLKDDASGAGISYAASASAWRWTKIAYPLTERIRRLSLLLGSGSANFYVGLSLDDVTYTWYSGALTGFVLALVASEAAAQAAAPLFGALPGGYAELPATIEARYIKIGHRNTTTGYRLDEAYGQRLVIADVIKVGQLSAIAADMGSITAGTITGATVQTAASGQRVVLNTAGIASYDTGGSQVAGISSADGSVSIVAPAAVPTWTRSYGFVFGGVPLGGVQGYGGSGAGSVMLRCEQRSGADSQASVISVADTNELSTANLLAYNGVGLATQASVTASSRFNDGSAHDSTITLFADAVTVNTAGGSAAFGASGLAVVGGLNLGSATGAAAGTIRASGYTAGGLFFQGASDLIAQDTSNLFWDDTNNRLGIGNAAPATTLHVTGTVRATAGLTLDFITAGSLLFGGASGVVSQDNSNLFWDNTNKRLNIGAAPSAAAGLGVAFTDPTAASATSYGSQVEFTSNPGATALTGQKAAQGFSLFLNGSGGGAAGTIYGIIGEAKNQQSGGTLAAARGASLAVWTTGAGNITTGVGAGAIPVLTSSGNIVTWHAFDAFSPVFTSTGTITTSVAFYATKQKVTGVTTGYGIFQADAADINHFAGNVNCGTHYEVSNTQVVGARVTGWNAPTTGGGALLRGTFDTGATLVTTARTLAALIADLRSHGLINT